MRGGYGAIFASPGEFGNSHVRSNLDRAGSHDSLLKLSWLFVKMKQSRLGAKIVTNLLILLSVLGVVIGGYIINYESRAEIIAFI